MSVKIDRVIEDGSVEVFHIYDKWGDVVWAPTMAELLEAVETAAQLRMLA